MALRVFISHSSKKEDPLAVRFAEELAERLRQAGMVVLMDKLVLKEGDDWRPMINAWIGGCRAAVLIISEAANTRSSYVPYEASVLAFRHVEEKSGFKLLPVLLDPLTVEQVKEGPLSPCCVPEIQSYAVTAATCAAVLDRLVERLQEIEDQECPNDRHARRLGEYLKKIDTDLLAQAGAKVQVDTDAWAPGDPPPVRAARRMVSAGLCKETVAAMRVIVPELESKRERESVFHLVACAWVDPQSSVLLERAGESAGPRVVALNASLPDTARLYVVHASEYELKRPWPVARVNTAQAGDLETLEAGVAAALAAELKVDADELTDALDVYAEQGEPVFAALPALDAAGRAALRAAFPTVVFFLLAGPSGVGKPAPADVDVLAPIEAHAEEMFWKSWKKYRLYLQLDA